MRMPTKQPVWKVAFFFVAHVTCWCDMAWLRDGEFKKSSQIGARHIHSMNGGLFVMVIVMVNC